MSRIWISKVKMSFEFFYTEQNVVFKLVIRITIYSYTFFRLICVCKYHWKAVCNPKGPPRSRWHLVTVVINGHWQDWTPYDDRNPINSPDIWWYLHMWSKHHLGKMVLMCYCAPCEWYTFPVASLIPRYYTLFMFVLYKVVRRSDERVLLRRSIGSSAC